MIVSLIGMGDTEKSSIDALANKFRSLFINKISIIRSSVSSDSYCRVLNPPDTGKVLQNVICVTDNEVHVVLFRLLYADHVTATLYLPAERLHSYF